MSDAKALLAVIPARAGSKGLPGKNVRPFVGLPLIAHSILFAKLCPEITRVVVSTDSPEIAGIARHYGAAVPFMRPAELAQDDSPLWLVLHHALDATERLDGRRYDLVALLDPTSPAREPADIERAMERLDREPSADGVIGVSRPDFNPIWTCVTEQDGWMTYLMKEGIQYGRRQDVPVVYRINGVLYIWRTAFLRSQPTGWQGSGRHVMYEIPERRAMSIDELYEFERAETLVKSGLVKFPWLERCGSSSCSA